MERNYVRIRRNGRSLFHGPFVTKEENAIHELEYLQLLDAFNIYKHMLNMRLIYYDFTPVGILDKATQINLSNEKFYDIRFQNPYFA